MSVYDSHEIATQVRIKVKETLDWVADVLVHVEPLSGRYQRRRDAWKIVKSRACWPRPRT